MKQIVIQSKKHGIKSVIFDDCDYDLLSKFRWHLCKGTKTFYAVSNTGEQMHQILLKSDFVDHADGNGLNNTRSNIRACTQAENNVNQRLSKNNKSGFKGVSFEKSRNKYIARLGVNYKGIVLGRFDTAEQAARAYNEAAFREFGQFAKLNILPKDRKLNPCIYQWTTIVQNSISRT